MSNKVESKVDNFILNINKNIGKKLNSLTCEIAHKDVEIERLSKYKKLLNERYEDWENSINEMILRKNAKEKELNDKNLLLIEINTDISFLENNYIKEIGKVNKILVEENLKICSEDRIVIPKEKSKENGKLSNIFKLS